jgi:glycosyltransferase involved in cell wall biosynthesis
VSIVVPAYNREDYLGVTLDSVLAQTTTSWELVVSDDGSTDGTRALADRYAAADPRITVVGGANAGVATARNRGYAATGGRSAYVIFLDSDDLWEPDTLAVLLDVLDRHPEYVSVYGIARCVDHRGERIADDDLEERMRERMSIGRDGLVAVPAADPTTFAGLVFHNWVVTPGLQLTRREVLDGVSAFDPETDPADDWDYAIRVSRHGDIGFVDRTVLNWRRHEGTLTTTSRRQTRAHFRVRSKTLTDPDNTPEQRRLTRLAWRLMSRDMRRNARALFRERQYARGGRQAARAVEGVARYWLAVAISSRRRVRRPTSFAPSPSGR